jgi:hypothetical protein
MSYMRGAHYLWRDDQRIHFWAATGYDGWDQSVWAEGEGIDTEAVLERPKPAPSGVALPQTIAEPQTIADEYVLLRLAELVAAGDAVATLDRALGHHAGNGGAVALVDLGQRLRSALADLEA